MRTRQIASPHLLRCASPAVHRRGFCQYYAAMMTAFLREEGIPARVVQGFLPGERSVSAGTETVRNDRAHAWVEVYFPDYGWVEFDPTSIGALPGLPEGERQPSASPGSSAAASLRPRPSESADRDNEPGGAVPPIDRGGAAGPLIAVTMLLAVIMAAVAAIAWRRGPRGPVTADSAYGSVTRLASRFGFGPRPNQTVYEYAGALADLLPSARPELEMVAQAKVEVAYGGRLLGGEALSGLREAQRLAEPDHRPPADRDHGIRPALLQLGGRRFNDLGWHVHARTVEDAR